MENSNQYGDVDNEQPISTFDPLDTHNKRRSFFLYVPIIIIALVVFWVLFVYFGFSKNNPNRFLITSIMLVGFILLTFVHEGAHFVFQWIFSRKKPKIGCKQLTPYSALAADVRVTRNQAILFSLAPFLFITPLLIISLFFASNFFRLVTITIGILEVASCSTDFLATYWLLKHPKKTWLENVNLVNTLFSSPH